MARGFSSIPDRKIRISTVPGEWREVLECENCDAQGECEVEEARMRMRERRRMRPWQTRLCRTPRAHAAS